MLARKRATAPYIRRRSWSGGSVQEGSGLDRRRGQLGQQPHQPGAAPQLGGQRGVRRCGGGGAPAPPGEVCRGADPPAAGSRRPAPEPYPAARHAASCSRRDLPMPGSPASSNSGGPLLDRWRGSKPISRARPANGRTEAGAIAAMGGSASWRAATKAARSCAERSRASASRRSVSGRAKRRSPRSRLLIVRSLRPAVRPVPPASRPHVGGSAAATRRRLSLLSFPYDLPIPHAGLVPSAKRCPAQLWRYDSTPLPRCCLGLATVASGIVPPPVPVFLETLTLVVHNGSVAAHGRGRVRCRLHRPHRGE